MRCRLCTGPLAWAEEWGVGEWAGTLVSRVLRCRWCLTEQGRESAP